MKRRRRRRREKYCTCMAEVLRVQGRWVNNGRSLKRWEKKSEQPVERREGEVGEGG